MNLPIDLTQVQNVLILRTDHLGDLLLSTPLIRTMRTALPGCRFTLVTSPANTAALNGWDALDDFLFFDPSWSLTRKWRFILELRQTRWDLCLTLSPRTNSYVLGWLSGAAQRAGIVYSRRILARLFSPLFLTHSVVMDIDGKLAAGQPVPHEVMQLADLAVALGLPKTEPGPLEFPLTAGEVDWANRWLTDNWATPPASCLIGIHGAGKWLSHGWNAQDFLSLVRAIAEIHPNTKVLLTFGPGDTVLQHAVTDALERESNPAVLNPGQLPISRWAALLSLCDAVVSPDTGSLHLAVALARPVVAMYENDNFAHCSAQWAPWQVPSASIRRGTPTATIPLLAAEVLRLIDRKVDYKQ